MMVNFSDVNDTYYLARKCVTTSDEQVLLSQNHPDL